jgi:hypothetical protein
MNGRVSASAGVLALGIILMIGGAWGIWRGSAYIQLEWGWSSVISGSVAATGGVLTVALALVLRRLERLHQALLGAAAIAQPVEAPLVLAPATEAMPLGLEPAVGRPLEEPHPPAYADPTVAAVAALNLEFLGREASPAAAEPLEGPRAAEEQTAGTGPSEPQRHASEGRSSEPLPEILHAADDGPADDMVKAAGVSDEPELDAAIEELFAHEHGRAQQQGAHSREAAPIASSETSEPVHEASALAQPEKARVRTGWRGLFSRKQRSAASPPAEQVTAEPVAASNTSETAGMTPSSSEAAEPAPLDRLTVRADAIPRTGDDWFDRALSGLDEVDTYAPAGHAGSHTAPLAEHQSEDAGTGGSEGQPAPPQELPPSPPAPDEPAVIGRYTSGNTTYIMFADGSIEAETPTGVLHFASLAALKVYVEGGQ